MCLSKQMACWGAMLTIGMWLTSQKLVLQLLSLKLDIPLIA